MSFFDDVGDAVSDAADVVVDVVEGAVELAGDALEAIASVAVDAIEGTGEILAAAAEAGAQASLDLSDAMLTAMDDVVFDTVDFVTGGLIDVDYDDGAFGASVGIDDVFGFSVHVSENGFDAGYDAWVVGADVALNADGISASGSMGVDWGPLPYVEGHVSVDENGNVGVGGQVQVYLPTPAGLSGVELEGDYQETDEGYRVSGSVTGGHYAYTGTYGKAGVHTAYEEDADGYKFQVGVHGELGQVGVGSVTASVDYVEGREGSVSYEGVSVEAGAEGFGASVEVEGSYTHLETPEGEIDVVTGTVMASAAGNTVTATGGVLSGPGGTETFGEVTHEVDELGMAMSAAEVAGDMAGVGGPSDLGLPVGDMKDMLGGSPGDILGETAGGILGETATDALGGSPGDILGDTATGVLGETAADLAGGSAGDFLGETATDILGETATNYVGDTTSDVLGAATDALGTAASDMLAGATDDILGGVPGEAYEGATDVLDTSAGDLVAEYVTTETFEEAYVDAGVDTVIAEAVEVEVVTVTYDAPREEPAGDTYYEPAEELA